MSLIDIFWEYYKDISGNTNIIAGCFWETIMGLVGLVLFVLLIRKKNKLIRKMPLIDIKSKYIVYEIFLQIPVTKRLGIIDRSKAHYDKLEYLYITKKLYKKIYDYLNNKFENRFKSSFLQETELKIIQYNSIDSIIKDLSFKLKKEFSKNFNELLHEIIFEILKLQNIYISNKEFKIEFYDKLIKFNFDNNIIIFNDFFCKILNNQLIDNLIKKGKIYGIIVIFKNINIKNLDILNKIFKNIHFLKLDFTNFFNDFNDEEINKIFIYINKFSENNPIEILDYEDDTERTITFVSNFQKFTKNLNNLKLFYIKKYFGGASEVIREAYKNDNEKIIDSLEDPNLILHNYLMNINDKIKILNMDISNPCSINGDPGGGSFIDLATPNEDFTVISKFRNLEELVINYDWPAEYYFGFDEDKSFVNAINNLKCLKSIFFKEDKYLYFLQTLPLIKVDNCKFSFRSSFPEFFKAHNNIISSESLNNFKNFEIISFYVKMTYKDKTLKYEIDEYLLEYLYFFKDHEYKCLNIIESLIIIVKPSNSDISVSKKNNNYKNLKNLFLYLCKNNNNNLKNLKIDYSNYDLNEILNILVEYTNLNNKLKNIELKGKIENNINNIMDNITKIKNKNVIINVNI